MFYLPCVNWIHNIQTTNTEMSFVGYLYITGVARQATPELMDMGLCDCKQHFQHWLHAASICGKCLVLNMSLC